MNVRPGLYYGWVVVASAFTLTFVGFGTAYSFAAFFGALQAEFSASRAHVSLVFSVAAFLWFALGAPGGLLADRFGPRRVALAGVAGLTAAFVLASLADSVAMLYLTFSVGVGLGIGLTYVPSVSAVQPWFTGNRAFASGLAVSGIGAGSFVVPPLVAWWIELFGWRGAFQALALFALVLAGAAALAVHDDPGGHRAAPVRKPPSGQTLGEALRSAPFWTLYASLLLACVGLLVPIVHLGPYAQDAGRSPSEGVGLVSMIGLGSLFGRFAIGGLADRLGRQRSLAAMYAGLGLMFLLWWSTTEYWMLVVFALVFGVCNGGFVALLPTIVMDLFGQRAVAAIIGTLYTAAGVGSLAGPTLAGAAYDAFASYQVPQLAGAALSLAAAALVWRGLRRSGAG